MSLSAIERLSAGAADESKPSSVGAAPTPATCAAQSPLQSARRRRRAARWTPSIGDESSGAA